MDTVSVAPNSPKVSRIGFGCCPMGQHGWGETDEKALIKAANTALDRGIQFFDTADIYGLGKSEEILGKALKSRREEAFIATKFGVRLKDGKTFYDNSPSWIRHSVSNSLNRLNCDCIDLYQIHYWDEITPLDVVFETLESLRTKGMIKSYGFTNLTLGTVQPNSGMSSFSFEYSLANRKYEKDIKDIQNKYDIAFLSWGSLGQGILSGKYTKESLRNLPLDDRRRRKTYTGFHGRLLESNLQTVEYLKQIATKHGNTVPAQVAIRWILDKFENSIALIGIKNPNQLDEAAECLDWRLEPKDFALLEESTIPDSLRSHEQHT